MTLNPIIALDHVIEEYRDHLQSEFRAHDRTMRQALETELDRPLSLAQPVIDLPMGGRGGEWARRRMGEAANGRGGEWARRRTVPAAQQSKLFDVQTTAAPPGSGALFTELPVNPTKHSRRRRSGG